MYNNDNSFIKEKFAKAVEDDRLEFLVPELTLNQFVEQLYLSNPVLIIRFLNLLNFKLVWETEPKIAYIFEPVDSWLESHSTKIYHKQIINYLKIIVYKINKEPSLIDNFSTMYINPLSDSFTFCDTSDYINYIMFTTLNIKDELDINSESDNEILTITI
jgi:hypothetical protein